MPFREVLVEELAHGLLENCRRGPCVEPLVEQVSPSLNKAADKLEFVSLEVIQESIRRLSGSRRLVRIQEPTLFRPTWRRPNFGVSQAGCN
jgi:hypothetical protein